jgi:hypothetical protein
MGIPGRFNVDPWFSKPTSSTTPIQNRQTTKRIVATTPPAEKVQQNINVRNDVCDTYTWPGYSGA